MLLDDFAGDISQGNIPRKSYQVIPIYHRDIMWVVVYPPMIFDRKYRTLGHRRVNTCCRFLENRRDDDGFYHESVKPPFQLKVSWKTPWVHGVRFYKLFIISLI